MRKQSLGLPIVLFLVVAASAFGQARDTASIYGTVSDAQGARVPEATVTLTSAATGQVRTATTDATGGYVYSLLPVGTYDVTRASKSSTIRQVAVSRPPVKATPAALGSI